MSWYKQANFNPILDEYIIFVNDPNNVNAIVEQDENSQVFEFDSSWPQAFKDFFNDLRSALLYEKKHPEIIEEWLNGKSLHQRIEEASIPPLSIADNKAKQVADVYRLINSGGHSVKDGVILVNILINGK